MTEKGKKGVLIPKWASEEAKILRAEAMIQQQPSLPLTHLLLLCLQERRAVASWWKRRCPVPQGCSWSRLEAAPCHNLEGVQLPGGVAAQGAQSECDSGPHTFGAVSATSFLLSGGSCRHHLHQSEDRLC